MSSQRILVTGAAGAVGSVVAQILQQHGHIVRGFDRVEMPNVSEQVVAQLSDVSAIQRAMNGIDALIHLAATPDAADFTTDLVPNNIIAPWHVLEAARDAQVKRVILASTIRVGNLHDWSTHTVSVAEGLAPHDAYSFTKAACEIMGELFARKHGMTVIMARLGWLVRNPQEVERLAENIWKGDIALTQDDAARFFVACVENPLQFPTTHHFAAMYVTSKQTHRPTVDLSEAKNIMGWEPQNIWPEGTPWVELFKTLKK